MLTDEQEIQAIEQAQQGNLQAFNRLVEAYQAQAFNVAYRLIGQREAAADATQEAFVSAYRHLRQYRGGSFKSWLTRIVVNSSYDLLRQARVRSAESLDDLSEHGLDPADPGEGPEAGALRADQRRALERCLATLPAEQRAVLVLSDVQGTSYSEIAAALRTSLGTVKSRLSRARQKMRHCLTASGVLA